LFCDAGHGVRDLVARRSPVIGEGAAHRQAVRADRLSFAVATLLQGPFTGANAAHLLLQLRLGMSLRISDGLRGVAQVLRLAELVGDLRQDGGDSGPDGLLPGGDDAADGE
jgi:hypothetical protein